MEEVPALAKYKSDVMIMWWAKDGRGISTVQEAVNAYSWWWQENNIYNLSVREYMIVCFYAGIIASE